MSFETTLRPDDEVFFNMFIRLVCSETTKLRLYQGKQAQKNFFERIFLKKNFLKSITETNYGCQLQKLLVFENALS